MMFLKEAFGPSAILAAVPLLPTYLFYRTCKKEFLPSFEDIGLFQAFSVDCVSATNENAKKWNFKERENFLHFLVDAHKAAYIPICIAEEGAIGKMTAEPAKTVKLESDRDYRRVRSSNLLRRGQGRRSVVQRRGVAPLTEG